MQHLIEEYMVLFETTTKNTKRAEEIMHILFAQYFDKLIYGMIYNGKYRFWRFGDIDELFQEGRLAIISSIHKKQFNPERGSLFNFFSTVVAKNLMNYTKKQNKYLYRNIDADVSDVFNHNNVKYHQNFNDVLMIDDAFNALRKFFQGKKKFEELTELLYHYYQIYSGKNFVKKSFIAFAKAHNYSPASVNNFFSYAKKLSLNKEIKILLEVDEDNY